MMNVLRAHVKCNTSLFSEALDRSPDEILLAKLIQIVLAGYCRHLDSRQAGKYIQVIRKRHFKGQDSGTRNRHSSMGCWDISKHCFVLPLMCQKQSLRRRCQSERKNAQQGRGNKWENGAR